MNSTFCFKWIYGLLAMSIFQLAACSLPPLQQAALQSQSQASLKNQPAEALRQEFFTKPAYTSPLRISVDTSLLNVAGPAAKQIELPVDSDFQIQALPQGPIVFQESFTKGEGFFENTRGFRVPDTSRRYTVHIANQSPAQSNATVSVNLNGIEYIKDSALSSPDQELERSGLILNANNALRVRLSGSAGTSVLVTLVETGEAGTILRKREWNQANQTQARRVQQNDTNIFDPHDPGSLGGLTPYEGHLQDADAPPGVTGVLVDNVSLVMFEAGHLILRLREPEVILPILQSQYGAEILHQQEIPGHPELTYYYLRFDLEQSPLAKTQQLIKTYRNRIPAQFNEFTFASVSAFQTFVILMDLLVEHEEYIATWELNTYSPPPLVNPAEPVITNDWNAQDDNPANANNRGWWLRDTFVLNAWNYSLGTGVNAAYVDKGFWKALTGNVPHPEFGERLKTDYAILTQNITLMRRPAEVDPLPGNSLDCDPRPNKDSYCNGDHGTSTAMVGFAQRNNGPVPLGAPVPTPSPSPNGTAGSAPNANLIPFAADGYMYTYGLALADIATGHITGSKPYDVVGYNKQDQVPRGWTPVTTAPGAPGNDPFSMTFLKAMFSLLSDAGVPVVVAAGNDGERCPRVKNAAGVYTHPMDSQGNCLNHFIPSSFLDQPSVITPSQTIQFIVAGGARRDGSKASVLGTPAAGTALTQTNPTPAGEISSWSGSAIGKNYIWAPAEVEVFDVGFSSPHASPAPGTDKVNRKAGTSMSCPMLTGVVALMKSRNPDLTIAEIRSILSSSTTRIDITHASPPPATVTNISPADYSNQPFVNAWDAVEKAIRARKSGSTNPTDYVAKVYFALVMPDSGPAGKALRLNAFTQNNAAADEKSIIPLKSVAENVWNQDLAPGQVVKVRGWTQLSAGDVNLNQQLEVLDAQVICPAGNCPQSPWFSPQITGITQVGGAGDAGGFDLVFTGQDLMAQLQDNKTAERFKLEVFPHGTSTAVASVGLIHQNQIKDIANDGSQVTIHFNQNQLTPGHYDFRLTGAGIATNLFQGAGSSAGFQVQAHVSGGGFSLLSAPPAGAEAEADVWVVSGSSRLPIYPGQTFGIAFSGQYDLAQLQISIDGQNVPLQQVAQNYVTGRMPEGLSPGVKDLILNLAGESSSLEQVLEVLALPLLHHRQNLTSPVSEHNTAHDIKQFWINGQLYLAISRIGNNPDLNIYPAVSIYRWQNQQFVFDHELLVEWSTGLSVFEINGQTFLISGCNQLSYPTPGCPMFRWEGDKFVLHQHFTGVQGQLPASIWGWEHFVIDGVHYLAEARRYSVQFGSNNNVIAIHENTTSYIYRWNGSQFVMHQGLNTQGIWNWTYFEYGGERYLAAANFSDRVNGVPDYNQNSRIYRWNGSQFALLQSIPTQGAYRWEAFEIAGQLYLGIVNGNPIGARYLRIYRWNGASFNATQDIGVNLARGVKFISYLGQDYLVMGDYNTQSADPWGIYLLRWNGEAFQVQQFASAGGGRPQYFEPVLVDGLPLLIAASTSSGGEQQALIYEFR